MLADANASQKFQNFKKLRKRMLMLSQIVYKSILSRFGLKPFSLVIYLVCLQEVGGPKVQKSVYLVI